MTLILPYPELPPAEREQLPMILETVRQLGARVDSRDIDRQGRIPQPLLDELASAGMFGLLIPAEHGGIGLSPSGYARVLQEMAGIDPAVAVTLGAHQAIGCRGIMLFGSAEQKARYLPGCASGETLASLGMTEPDAGSAIANTRTRAVREPDGSWVLNGTKTYITNGSLSQVFTVFARTEIEKRGVTQDRLSAFIVERGPGLDNGPPMDKMGIRGSSTTEIYLADARVPPENRLGPLGSGLRIARDIMTNGRVGLAAGCLGMTRSVLELAVGHATTRRLGPEPIARFDLIRRKIGDVSAALFAAESMVYLTTGLMGRSSSDFAVESSACKIYASETAWAAANEALQIAGGAGYMKDLPYERFVRDCRINTIFEGTSEILRLLVAMNSLEGPRRRLERLAAILREPAPGDASAEPPRIPEALGEVVAIAEAALDTADRGIAEALSRHGGQLSRLQLVQASIADIMTHVYGMAACLSRAAAVDPGAANAGRTAALCRAFCRRAAARIHTEVAALTDPDPAGLLEIADAAYDCPYPLDATGGDR